MLFPTSASLVDPVTCLVVDDQEPDGLPVIRWAGAASPSIGPVDGLLGLLGDHRGVSPLIEHAHGSFERPGLRGHRLAEPIGGPRDVAGRAWSTAFTPARIQPGETTLVVDAEDTAAGLVLRTEFESLKGGALRGRHSLTNTSRTPYLLEGLELTVPLNPDAGEILDFTGRHQGERAPQRHTINDGMWLRESRRGRPGLDAASVVVAGTKGFGFSQGDLLAGSVAHSGNSLIAVQRNGSAGATLSAGELLLPGEIVLLEGDTYTMPWVIIAASSHGLDAAAQALHSWQRTLPAHPKEQLVTLNVWEAVYFDHDAGRLRQIADLAAQVGVERFVLDDGWFHGRRDDTAGLGDWWVDPDVWPQGLGPLVDHVHGLGMQFGLWFEPEMVNPDSTLHRQHPDWILAPDGRVPRQHRNQQALDITNPDVWHYLRDNIDAVLSGHSIDYVKWDHNRDLLEAGSATHQGAPAAHAQNLAFYTLLDDLRERHPKVVWEACAAGGGRIDLGVIERVQRFWTSDMTDAIARQHIQRWTGQFVAPEYLGAHISAPTSHQTGRTLSLDFRAATAFFLAFGIEWDLTQANQDELNELASWCELHKQFRPLLHTGTVVRMDTTDPAVLAHGVVAADGESALLCHVQLDESQHNRGCILRISGLHPDAPYQARWVGPVDNRSVSMSPPLGALGPTNGALVTGRQLAKLGLWMPRRSPQTAQLIHLVRSTGREARESLDQLAGLGAIR
jgi:alpha-galactosidase